MTVKGTKRPTLKREELTITTKKETGREIVTTKDGKVKTKIEKTDMNNYNSSK